jgi:hypothetical protein
MTMSKVIGTMESGGLWFCHSCGLGFAVSSKGEFCLYCGAELALVLKDGQKERLRLRTEIEQLRNDLRRRDVHLRELENTLRETRQELGELPDYMQPLEGQLSLNINSVNSGDSE